MSREPNAASVAIVDGEKVLLIQRAREPYADLWTLPGGRREPGETAEQCAIREAAEELRLGIGGLVHVATNSVGDGWRLAVFATARFEGVPEPSDEIASFRWVTRTEVRTMATTPDLDAALDLAFGALQQRQSQQ